MNELLGLEVIRQLRDMGSDTSQPHGFDFFLYLPTEADARAAGEKVRERQFKAQILPAASGPGWLCKATITLVPKSTLLDEVGIFLQQVSTAFHGEYDGWESDIIKKT